VAVRSKKAASTRAKTLAWRRSTATVLSALLDEQGVSQMELARRTGWSRDKVTYLLSGKGKCEPGEVYILADAIGVPRDIADKRIRQWHG
jgi:lambda repressor-like predicted transcriptional regulator